MQSPEIRHVKLLLAPSSLSGVVVMAIMLILSVIVMLGVHYKESIFGESFSVASRSTNTAYLQFAHKFDSNALLSNVPLMLLWGCVGLIVYLFAVAVYRAFNDAAEIGTELSYVHANRRTQLTEVFVHLVVRVLALIGWVFYAKFFMATLLPQALASVRSIVVGGESLVMEVINLVGGFALGLLALHLHVVFLRLLVLKPRLWGIEYDVRRIG